MDSVFDDVQVPAAKNPYSNPHHQPRANPYSTPVQPSNIGYQNTPTGGNSTIGYTVPGVFITGWGGLLAIVVLLRIGLIFMVLVAGDAEVQVEDKAVAIGIMSMQMLFSGCISYVMLTGGISMVTRKNLGSAKGAAIIATIPCFGCLVFPFGIWACVMLYSDAARRDFAS